MPLSVSLKRISPTHHSFEYSINGKTESRELETKTYLFHDLLHFAVETEAGLMHSFYGSLASRGYEELDEQDMQKNPDSEITITERVVGPLTEVIKNNSDPKEFLAIMKNMFDAYNQPVPAWLTEDCIMRIKEKMRCLMGEWVATPFGKTMRLDFRIGLEQQAVQAQAK